jgi:hypothetical protein
MFEKVLVKFLGCQYIDSMKTNTAPLKEMTVNGIHHFVERAYRESHAYQYLRELVINSIEAGATRIEFGPDWYGVEHEKTYRLMVADNGRGMSPDELESFFSTLGGGGKTIGPEHANFGVGAKTSLLPWNHEGVVVISWTKENPEGAMIWMARDFNTGEYGTRMLKDVDGSFDVTVRPQGRWSKVRPPWLKESGTVLICIGNTGTEDTFVGKDSQGDLRAIATYLNKRLWEIPAGVEIAVQELRTQKNQDWPRNYAEASAGGPGADGVDRRWNRRVIRGAKYFVAGATHKSGHLGSAGTVKLADGTAIDWYLWEGDRPSVHSYAQEQGFLAAIYKNELYDLTTHGTRFRAFGITAASVRHNLTLIAKPPMWDGKYGVYPDTSRNSLKLQSKEAQVAGEPLPWDVWAEEFARNLPQEIADALAKAGPQRTGTLESNEWRQRLQDRFGQLWSSLRLVAQKRGHLRMVPDEAPGDIGSPNSTGEEGGSAEPQGREAPEGIPGEAVGHIGEQKGDAIMASAETPAAKTGARPLRTKGGLPSYEWTTMENTDEDGVYPVAWYRETASYPNGVVQMARDFPMIVSLKKFWRDQYPNHLGDEVDSIIEEVYGEAMVARIAHSEQLVHDPAWGKPKVETELRSQSALTASMLGLLSEDAAITTRLAKLGVRRHKAGT